MPDVLFLHQFVFWCCHLTWFGVLYYCSIRHRVITLVTSWVVATEMGITTTSKTTTIAMDLTGCTNSGEALQVNTYFCFPFLICIECNPFIYTMNFNYLLVVSFTLSSVHHPLALLPVPKVPITWSIWTSLSMLMLNLNWAFKSTTANVSLVAFFIEMMKHLTLTMMEFLIWRCSWKLLLPKRRQRAVMSVHVLPKGCKYL